MSEFIKLFENETVGTIEALIGEAPSLELKEEQELSIISNIIPPIVLVKISISGDTEAKAMIALPPNLAASLSDLMMGEELRDRGIPNIIEKRLLNMIATEKEITLKKIIESCKVMEKALNRKIEMSTIQKLLEKYVIEGVIFKKELN